MITATHGWITGGGLSVATHGWIAEFIEEHKEDSLDIISLFSLIHNTVLLDSVI